MIEAGADTVLPKSWLVWVDDYEVYSYNFLSERGLQPAEVFQSRWSAQLLVQVPGEKNGLEPHYTVSSLLEHFRSLLGSELDVLKILLDGARTAAV